MADPPECLLSADKVYLIDVLHIRAFVSGQKTRQEKTIFWVHFRPENQGQRA